MEWKEKDLNTAQEINGIPWSILEHRAKPLYDNTKDNQWRFRSLEGFIAEGESLREVMIKDSKIVEKLGTTHEILADSLSHLLKRTEEVRQEENAGPMRPLKVNYLAADLTDEMQHFVVERQVNDQSHCSYQLFNAPQYSLFYNESIDSPYNTSWNEEYTIKNMNLGLEMKIAGNATEGITDYIRRFGFYEGGINNSYRVDPRSLWALLTGRCPVGLIELLREKEQLKQKEVIEQLSKCQEMENSSTREQDRLWSKEMKQKLTQQLDELQTTSQQFLSHLQQFQMTEE